MRAVVADVAVMPPRKHGPRFLRVWSGRQAANDARGLATRKAEEDAFLRSQVDAAAASREAERRGSQGEARFPREGVVVVD